MVLLHGLGTAGALLLADALVKTHGRGLVRDAGALTSSIFALIGFAILEGVKIRLFTRLLSALREVEGLYSDAESKRNAAGGGASSAGGAALQGAEALA